MLGDGQDKRSGFDHHATTCTVTAASLISTKGPVSITVEQDQGPGESNSF